jgi:hypothetical protein
MKIFELDVLGSWMGYQWHFDVVVPDLHGSYLKMIVEPVSEYWAIHGSNDWPPLVGQLVAR